MKRLLTKMRDWLRSLGVGEIIELILWLTLPILMIMSLFHEQLSFLKNT